MTFLWTSIFWFLILLFHKMFKDSIINKQRDRIKRLEAVWKREKNKQL